MVEGGGVEQALRVTPDLSKPEGAEVLKDLTRNATSSRKTIALER
jgi:DNA-binding protein YbaB